MKNATFVVFGELLLGPFARETVRLLCNSLVHTSLLYIQVSCTWRRYSVAFTLQRVCALCSTYFSRMERRDNGLVRVDGGGVEGGKKLRGGRRVLH